MILFNNSQELWQFLLSGGTIREKRGNRKIKMQGGNPTYEDGSSARNCLLSYNYWFGLEKDLKEQTSVEFCKAIDYAIEGRDQFGHTYTDQEGMNFLRMWREGDWKGIAEEFPTFQLDMMK